MSSSKSFFYGFINLDWTIPWIDGYNQNVNNATFDSSGNIPGTFSFFTNPSDTSGTVKEQFYNGTLNNIHIYDSYGDIIQQEIIEGDKVTYYIPLITYNTSQYGSIYLDKNNNYVYPNSDSIIISNFYTFDSSSNPQDIVSNFNVYYLYTTEYESNFKFDLTKSNGCRLPFDSSGIHIISNIDTTSITPFNYIYEIYFGYGLYIPEYLRIKFNISLQNSLNPFLSKESTAVLSDGTPYWQYFSDNNGNPLNTGWIIVIVNSYSK